MKKFLIIVSLVLCAIPSISHGAIAWQASSSAGTGSGTNVQATIVPGAGSNIMGVVCVAVGGNDNLTGLSWGGVNIFGNMIGKQQLKSSGSPNNFEYMFLYAGPPTTSQTVSATVGSANGIDIAINTYTGVNQSNSADATSTNQADTGTSVSKAVTTVTDNDWLSSCLYTTGSSINAGSNTTKRVSTAVGGVPLVMGDSNTAETPPGSFSQAYSWTGSTFNDILIAALAPAAAAAASPPPPVMKSLWITDD